ncbi:MAG TPA: hypothetical protein VNQ99_04800 [Xanthobacteraceae bacterium]|nr:hypothetical protein [Xanthobacteraceae bacterium]
MTTKSTITVNGGAMPKFDRKAILVRAWAIFRETYHYPSVPFSSIGRSCFAWALRKAWAEAREAARLAAIPADVRNERCVILRDLIEHTRYMTNWSQATTRAAHLKRELAALQSIA